MSTRSIRNPLLLIALVATAALYASPAQAEASIFSAATEFFPAAKHGSNDENILVFKTNAQFPIPVTKRLIFIPGAMYRLARFDKSDINLHRIMLSLGNVVRITDKLSTTVSVGGGFSSDFDHKLAGDEFLVEASLLVSYQLLPQFGLGVGVGYSRQLGKLFPIPLVGVDFMWNNFRIEGTIPSNTLLAYRVLPWLIVGAREELDGTRFYLDRERFNRPDSVEVAYSLLSLTGQVTLSPTPWINFDLYGGIALFRKYEVFVDGKSVGDATIDSGPVVGIRFRIGPRWREPYKTNSSPNSNNPT